MGRRGERASVLGPLSPAFPNSLLSASTHDISPVGRNGIFPFQVSASEKGPRLKFSFHHQPEKRQRGVKIRDTSVGFSLPPPHLSPAGSRDAGPTGPAAAACCCWVGFAGSPAVPTLASSPPGGSYLFDSSLGKPFGSTGWYLTWKSEVSGYRHQVAAGMT